MNQSCNDDNEDKIDKTISCGSYRTSVASQKTSLRNVWNTSFRTCNALRYLRGRRAVSASIIRNTPQPILTCDLPDSCWRLRRYVGVGRRRVRVVVWPPVVVLPDSPKIIPIRYFDAIWLSTVCHVDVHHRRRVDYIAFNCILTIHIDYNKMLSHDVNKRVKPGFHYRVPELTARVDGWPVSITREHGPCWRARVSTSRVDSGRQLG